MKDMKTESYKVTASTRTLNTPYKEWVHVEIDGVVLFDNTVYGLGQIEDMISCCGFDVHNKMLELLGFEINELTL
jgi:hypothetical protein